MLSGNGDDVFMVNHDTGRILKEKDLLVNLADSPVVSQYGDITKDQITDLSGRVYMLPMSVSMSGLYCNMDLLAENSITVPENLMQLQASCHAFFAKGITPLLVNKDYSLNSIAVGIGFYDTYREGRVEETLSKINQDPEKLRSYLKPGYEKVEEFIEKGYIDRQKAAKTRKTTEDLEEFAKGEYPFMITGAWLPAG